MVSKSAERSRRAGQLHYPNSKLSKGNQHSVLYLVLTQTKKESRPFCSVLSEGEFQPPFQQLFIEVVRLNIAGSNVHEKGARWLSMDVLILAYFVIDQ